jgi:Mg2+/Co2+ transporter CorC
VRLASPIVLSTFYSRLRRRAGGSGYATLAGFLMAETGQVPTAGQSVAYDGFNFTIERMDGRRIRRVRMASFVSEDRFEGPIMGLLPIVWAALASSGC